MLPVLFLSGEVECHVSRVFPHPASPEAAAGSARDLTLAHLDLDISITKVKSVSGDASTMFNRGKKKYIYDFNAECEWKFQAYTCTESNDKGSPVLTANGTLNINDITTGDDECEIEVQVSKSNNHTSQTISNNEFNGILMKHVRKSGKIDNLQAAIKTVLRRFDSDYKESK